ncbi:MAG: hypothetical protein P4L69_15555 [Desulfosporosinus sp.]|nr:hypothetical protein [Desulfosporosinus sp.]
MNMGAYVRISKRKEGSTTYHKHGKAYCSGHQISHDDLDSIIFNQFEKAAKALEILKEIIEKKELTQANVNKIMIHERKGEELEIEVERNTPFDNALAEVI